jgi:peptidoglycan/LPS O-acetylase OafA/YrhL
MASTVFLLTGFFELKFIYGNIPLIFWSFFNKIGQAFQENFYPRSVNGALWTLPWELIAYLLIAALGVFGLLKKRYIVLLVAIFLYASFVIQILSYPGRTTSPAISSGVRLLCFFLWLSFFSFQRPNCIK